MIDYNPKDFKLNNGRYITKSLFVELTIPSKPEREMAVFTTDDEDRVIDGKTYYSLKKFYLAMEDIHEYDFANTYLHGWKHWQAMCGSPVLAPMIQEWRDELEIKIRSSGFKRFATLAAEGNKDAIKYMADKGWEGTKRGRPSKAEVEKERKIQAGISKEYDEDYKRMLQ